MVLFRQQGEPSGAVPRLLRVSPLRHSFRVTTSTFEDNAYSSDADSTISVPEDITSDKKEPQLMDWFTGKDGSDIGILSRILEELATMDRLTTTSLLGLLVTVLLLGSGYYYSRRFQQEFQTVLDIVKDLDNQLTHEEMVHNFVNYIVNLHKSSGTSLNMALFMSEMRRKGKIRRPRRPQEVKELCKDLLPGMRASRVEKDGVAVLDIRERDREPSELLKTEDLSTSFEYNTRLDKDKEEIAAENYLVAV